MIIKLIPIIFGVYFALLSAVSTSEYSSFSFWHICDIHLDISSSADQINYNSDSPPFLVSSAISAMASVNLSPTFIIWNGDNAAHKHFNNESFVKTIKSVSDELRAKFPHTNILPSLGNHDLNPSDQIDEDSSWCNSLFTYWESFFTNYATEMTTFKHGCFYSRYVNVNDGRVKVIVLNTILWYSNNYATKHLDDPKGQFIWMKKELEVASLNNIKVFIVGHVPPGASEYSPNKYRHLHPQFNQMLLNILQNYSHIIEAGFFSHQHTDSFKVVYNPDGKPGIPLYLSPSVTPLHLRGMGSINPSIRLYSWSNNESGRYYDQYHTTVGKIWSLEYNSRVTMPGLSAFSLDSLLNDFSLPNSVYFNEFFKRHLSGRVHDNNETCAAGSECRCQIICGLKHISYADLEVCLRSCKIIQIKRTSSAQIPMIVSVIILFTVVLIAVIFGVNRVYCHQRRSASLTRDIFMATYNGKDCEQIVSDHIDNIAEVTFGDVPEYRGHMRNNSRTILTLNDGNEISVLEKAKPTVSKFTISNSKNKSQEKYDYSRM